MKGNNIALTSMLFFYSVLINIEEAEGKALGLYSQKERTGELF